MFVEYYNYVKQINYMMGEVNAHFSFTRLSILVSKDDIPTNPQKIEGLVIRPEPKFLSEVHEFLGLIGRYRIFIKGHTINTAQRKIFKRRLVSLYGQKNKF